MTSSSWLLLAFGIFSFKSHRPSSFEIVRQSASSSAALNTLHAENVCIRMRVVIA